MIARFAVAVLIASTAVAQRGDREGEVQPALPEDLAVPAAPALGPADALATLRVAAGYEVRLVAAEPLVEDPILLKFDAKGRPWVVEMRGYMPDVDGVGEEAPVGRIVVLDDDDGDGVYDRSTPFLEGLVLPRGLFLFEDGALVIEPPSLWFWRDTDGDGRADTREKVADGFEAGIESPEHCGNGLVWGIDGWLYLAKHPSRFRRTADGWEEDAHPAIGQWGLTRTDDGRLLYNYNSSYLYGDLIPGAYADRNPHLGRAHGCNLNLHRDQTVWPARMNPGVNRGYQKGLLRDDYTLSKFTATCSPEVYRGDLLTDAVGDVFVCEPSGNFVRRARLEDEGLRMAGAHVDPGGEFLTSTDERFRPVSLHNGPDGGLFVVDLYRGILQHRQFVTSFLRRQILDRGLDRPLGLGRIYEVVPAGHTPRRARDLSVLDGPGLVAALRDANGWCRDMAQRLLVERRPSDALPPLRALVRDASAAGHSRALALWTLAVVERLPRAEVLAALRSGVPELETAALRVGEPLLARGDALLRAWIERLAPDFSDRVALQAVLSASAARDVSLCATLAVPRLSERLFRDAALTGLAGLELEFAQRLMADDALVAAGSSPTPGWAAMLQSLGRCVGKERKPPRLSALLAMAARAAPWQGEALLEGLVAALPKGRKREGFYQLDAEPVALAPWLDTGAPWEDGARKAMHTAALALFPALHWGKPIAEPELSAELKQRFRVGAAVYARTCTHCHQRNGQGLDGLAPPLAGSGWVTEGPEALLRAIVGGVQGPIDVNGEIWDKAMEPHGFLSDEEVAAVATFVRMSWDNGGDPVAPAAVAPVRAEAARRGAPFGARDLR